MCCNRPLREKCPKFWCFHTLCNQVVAKKIFRMSKFSARGPLERGIFMLNSHFCALISMELAAPAASSALAARACNRQRTCLALLLSSTPLAEACCYDRAEEKHEPASVVPWDWKVKALRFQGDPIGTAGVKEGQKKRDDC